MRKSLLFIVIVILCANCAQVVAQDAPKGPPKVLYIVREDIKPGMMEAHTRHSSSYAGVFRTLGTPNHRIALVPVAGSENDVIYITGVDSFKELEDLLNATDKKMASAGGNTKAELDRLGKEAAMLHAGMRDMFAVFRPELSFNPGVDIRKMRFFSITTVRIRPGHDAEYADYVQKMVNVARQKAKVDSLHIAAFQITNGAQAGTYMMFRPLRSLAELDEQIPVKVRAAMSDDMKKDADKAAGNAIMSSENSIYMFAPGMSYVDKEFTDGDPSFWTPKPAPMARPKPKPKPAAPAAPTQ